MPRHAPKKVTEGFIQRLSLGTTPLRAVWSSAQGQAGALPT